MDTKVLICCAGPSSRWGNYLGVPKHLVPINNVPLIQRTTNQLNEIGLNNITIIGFNPQYQVDGAVLQSPTSTGLPNTGIGHSMEFWDRNKNNLILLGDVYFSNDAIKTIFNNIGDITFYGRSTKGKNGHKWGELFGLSFAPDKLSTIKKGIEQIIQAKRRKEINRAGGWELYRQLFNIPFQERCVTSNFIEIDDETEDFDVPEDYNKWKAANRK